MILYYSATGNTKFIAKLLAKQLDDECVDLLERIRTNDTSSFHSEKPFVICTPIYICEPPIFLMKYLKKVTFTGDRRMYLVCTSGGYAGAAGPIMHRLALRKKMKYMGRAEVTMPRNYMANTLYSMLTPEASRERILKAGRCVPGIARRIKAGERLWARYIFLFERLIIYPFTPFWARVRQSSKPFHTTEACVGCGKCARLCPLNNIEMVDRKPVWKKSCAHCMACIGNCPFHAIEYGDITRTKEKYNIGNYVKKKFL